MVRRKVVSCTKIAMELCCSACALNPLACYPQYKRLSLIGLRLESIKGWSTCKVSMWIRSCSTNQDYKINSLEKTFQQLFCFNNITWGREGNAWQQHLEEAHGPAMQCCFNFPIYPPHQTKLTNKPSKPVPITIHQPNPIKPKQRNQQNRDKRKEVKPTHLRAFEPNNTLRLFLAIWHLKVWGIQCDESLCWWEKTVFSVVIQNNFK